METLLVTSTPIGVRADAQDAAMTSTSQPDSDVAPIRVALAEAYPITLLGLQTLLSAEADFQIVCACSSLEALLQTVATQQPDVILLDSELLHRDDALLKNGALGDSKTVIFAPAVDHEQACDALRHGAKGILLKEMPTHLILQCLRRVHAGGQWLERRSMSIALERFMRREMELDSLAERLSPRELELAHLVAGGCCNKAIAHQLTLSEGSVRVFLTRIYDKLQVPNRTRTRGWFRPCWTERLTTSAANPRKAEPGMGSAGREPPTGSAVWEWFWRIA